MDSDSGEVSTISPDEIMGVLGFTDAQKNWARLMYEVVTGNVIHVE